ncbi:MAG: transferase [Rivularia sp. (in: Bacteria)]|nr:transferase [Rivularia sp. MS3]
MSVPPLRLYSNFETFFSGEVIIHASAVIAPGVIMQAAPDSKIIIGSGVCIGMGSILQVDTGILEIESGANLGAGFLMVGAGKIGANACIGSATTVFRACVKPGEVVPPGSIVGDSSRSFTESSTKEMNGRVHQPQLPVAEEDTENRGNEDTENSSVNESPSPTPPLSHSPTPPVTPSPRPYVSPSPISYFSLTKESTEEIVSSDNSPEESVNTNNTQDTEDSSVEEPANTNSNGIGNHIYGRSSIKSLLVTLFPHRQNLNEPDEDESEEG